MFIYRNHRLSSLGLTRAMTFALLIMILYSGLFEGYILGMRRNILDLELGEIQVHAQNYRKSPSMYKRIENEKY